jgi:thiol-disulfide isomerase/thioredoxin
MKRALLLSIALHLLPAAARADSLAPKTVEIVPAELPAIMAAVRAPGAKAVLVNVWASWCEPCREEMPSILRFYREHKARGLRLVLVSADDSRSHHDAEEFLASLGVDFRSYRKLGDDMKFIDGMDRRWDGTIPASFGYDGAGKPLAFWSGQVDYKRLARRLDPLLGGAPKDKPRDKPGRKP